VKCNQTLHVNVSNKTGYKSKISTRKTEVWLEELEAMNSGVTLEGVEVVLE
jgi:post-segregation antitoxin (ccd killing protein)